MNTRAGDQSISRQDVLESQLFYNGKLFKTALICSFAYLVFWTILTLVTFFVDDPGDFATEMPPLYSALSFLIYTVTLGIFFVTYIGSFLNLRREIRKKFASKDKVTIAGIYFLIQFSGVLFIFLVLKNTWWGLSGLALLLLITLYYFLKKLSKTKALAK